MSDGIHNYVGKNPHLLRLNSSLHSSESLIMLDGITLHFGWNFSPQWRVNTEDGKAQVATKEKWIIRHHVFTTAVKYIEQEFTGESGLKCRWNYSGPDDWRKDGISGGDRTPGWGYYELWSDLLLNFLVKAFQLSNFSTHPSPPPISYPLLARGRKMFFFSHSALKNVCTSARSAAEENQELVKIWIFTLNCGIRRSNTLLVYPESRILIGSFLCSQTSDYFWLVVSKSCCIWSRPHAFSPYCADERDCLARFGWNTSGING
jgi:hypothetical protein